MKGEEECILKRLIKKDGMANMIGEKRRQREDT